MHQSQKDTTGSDRVLDLTSSRQLRTGLRALLLVLVRQLEGSRAEPSSVTRDITPEGEVTLTVRYRLSAGELQAQQAAEEQAREASVRAQARWLTGSSPTARSHSGAAEAEPTLR